MISAATIVQDFNRRKIDPDWTHTVTQGHLRLWQVNNDLIAELYIGSVNGKSAPGTVMVRGTDLYSNTNSPQDIADDLMNINKLGKGELAEIDNMKFRNEDQGPWLTTVQIEKMYSLPPASVRRDIHRKKFDSSEINKVGRDWTVDPQAAARQYKKRRDN